jgi:hypothetical protein
LDRPVKPYEQVKAMLGSASSAWEKLMSYVRCHYVVDEKWAEGKPTHKHYNNLFVRRGGKSFIGLSLRDGYFQATITLGKEERERFDAERDTFSEAVRRQYDEAETLHDGKWLGFKVCDELPIDDIIRLLQIKSKPNRKVLPANIEMCGQLDIGMSREDISRLIERREVNNEDVSFK